MTVSALNTLTSGTAPAGASGGTPADSSDRFLKLLVTQMQNQDPLNPMDNAQITSQMAQINTVAGIEKLDRTVGSLNSQFVQLQALQGASLIGRGVLLAGNKLAMNSEGNGVGAFDLAGPADNVKLEVLNAAGTVIDSESLGAETSGRHGFTWTPPASVTDTSGLKFRITATSGSAQVAATPLMADAVVAVSAGTDQLTLSLLRSGDVAYSDVKGFN